jgi:hypothetical protein
MQKYPYFPSCENSMALGYQIILEQTRHDHPGSLISGSAIILDEGTFWLLPPLKTMVFCEL